MQEKEIRERIRVMLEMQKQCPKINIYDYFRNVNSQDKRSTVTILTDISTEKKKEVYNALGDWLDYLLEMFDSRYVYEGRYIEHIMESRDREPMYWELTCRWMQEVERSRTGGGFCDFFGRTYEEYFKSGYKASALGQFFTPENISRLCAEVTMGESETLTFTDCACGSGRMLLAGYEAYREDIDNDAKFHFFHAGDIDAISVKMCALNLMVHGLQGLVVCQNALLLDKPRFGYMINPADAPVRTGVMCVRYLSQEESVNVSEVIIDGKATNNLSVYMNRQYRLWCIAHGKEDRQTERHKEIQQRREPVQLYLNF